jgi:hypothetical protein
LFRSRGRGVTVHKGLFMDQISLFMRSYEYDGRYYAEVYRDRMRGVMVGRGASDVSEGDAVLWAWGSVDLAAICGAVSA